MLIPEKAGITELTTLFSQAVASGADPEIIAKIGTKLAAAANEVQEAQAKRDKLDAERKAKEDRQAKIDAEERYKPTRIKIYVRRSTDEEIDAKAPFEVVFDDIELQDIKGKHTGKTRIYTDERELKAYQDLKAEELENITYQMIEDLLKKAGNKDTVQAEPSRGEEGDATD